MPGKPLRREDFAYVLNMALASLTTYWIMTVPVTFLFHKPTSEIGALWAVISTLFVYRDTRGRSIAAGVSRTIATCVSVVLCTAYLSILPPSAVGMAALIAIGTVVLMLLGRTDDATTTAITTAVIMIIAATNPHDALHQPFLRLFDTLVGVVIGVAWKWLAAFSSARFTGDLPQ